MDSGSEKTVAAKISAWKETKAAQRKAKTSNFKASSTPI
jgi:hypothetical protein